MTMTRTWRFVLSEELYEAMHMAAAQKRISASQFTREAVQAQVDAIAVEKSQSIARVREMQQARP
jgi:hypothetical protein